MVAERPIAHQFWSGELTEYQIASMRSLQKSGFQVIFWSPESFSIDLPSGIIQENSELILDSSKIKAKYFSDQVVDSEKLKWAMYSDIFRVNVINKFGGWWFDSDFFALKDHSEFIKLENGREIVAGHGKSTDAAVENSVLAFPNAGYCDELSKTLTKKAHRSLKLPWGSLGSNEINNILIRYKLQKQLVPFDLFYPVHRRQCGLLFSSSENDRIMAESLCKDSLGFHWWNSRIDSLNELPKNSYIGKSFSSLD